MTSRLERAIVWLEGVSITEAMEWLTASGLRPGLGLRDSRVENMSEVYSRCSSRKDASTFLSGGCMILTLYPLSVSSCTSSSLPMSLMIGVESIASRFITQSAQEYILDLGRTYGRGRSRNFAILQPWRYESLSTVQCSLMSFAAAYGERLALTTMRLPCATKTLACLSCVSPLDFSMRFL